MTTILITGCAGLIGSHLVAKFINTGHKVIGIDSLIGGYRENLPPPSAETDPNFVFFNIDILDNAELSRITKFYKPETVIHCAALAHEGLSVFSPKIIVENIYAGTASIASAAISAGVKYFINTSSMARYGTSVPPFIEDVSIPNPVDPYGLAKLHAEQHLNLMSDIHGLKVFHMVPHNVCGPHQCYSDPFRNVMSIFANRILHDKPVYIYGDGEQKRSFSHIADCVDAFYILYNKKDLIANKEVFNIGPSDGSEITISELADLVHIYFNKQSNVINLPDRPREVKDAWVSTEKAQRMLDYNVKYTINDTIRDTTTWIRNSKRRDFNYHLPLEIITDKTPKTWTDRLFNK
jgi:UDP-glucose 4-epimerase